MGPRGLGQPTNHSVQVFDIIDNRAIGPAETIGYGAAVIVFLRSGNDLGIVAAMLSVNFPQQRGVSQLRGTRRRIRTEARIDEIIEAGQLLEAVLAAKLVVARDAALPVAKNIQGQNIDLAGCAL